MAAIKKLLDESTKRLRTAGVHQPAREAKLLLGHLLGVDIGGVIVRLGESLPPENERTFAAMVDRRASREPFQYITGEQEFRGLSMQVDRRALVPRPETEEVVGAALKLQLPDGASVVDLGTGTGCIAVSLAVERPDLRVHALDCSGVALDLARANAARHGVSGRIEFHEGTLESPPSDWLGRMDLVISNPPYVSEHDWKNLEPEVRDHEPREALVPGATGLEAYLVMAPIAYRLLIQGGIAVLELGYDSAPGAEAAMESAGFTGIEVFPDMAGIPRILVAVAGHGVDSSSS